MLSTLKLPTGMKLFSLKDKVNLALFTLARVVLNFLDLAGVVLVGFVIALVTQANLDQDSMPFYILNHTGVLAWPNAYVAISALALSFFILKSLLAAAITDSSARFLGKIEARVATQVFSNVLEAKAKVMNSLKKEEFSNAVTTSMNFAVAQMTLATMTIIAESSLLIAIALFLAYVNFLMFIGVTLFFLAIGYFMAKLVNSRADKNAEKFNHLNLELQSTNEFMFSMQREILAAGKGLALLRFFERKRHDLAVAYANYSTVITWPRYITEIAVLVAVALILISRNLPLENGAAPSTIGIFLIGVFRIVAAMLPLQTALATTKRLAHDSQNAIDFFSLQISKPHHARVAKIEHNPSLEFTEVTIPDRGKTFEPLSMKIPFRSLVVVQGKSGVGKSRFADLILGFEQDRTGAIRFGGHDVGLVSSQFPGSIQYVPQFPQFFRASIAENIAFNFDGSEIDHFRISKLLRELGLLSDINALPMGLHTQIGPGGLSLSGGQKQKLAIARALYTSPKLLILDEVTSAQDATSSSLIMDVIKKASRKSIVILISHHVEDAIFATHRIVIDKSKMTFSKVDAGK